MKSKKILILGATGMLGQPVTRCLVDKGHRVRLLTRNIQNARQMFGNAVEILAGSALDVGSLETAMAGCDAVHINLTQESEFTATRHVIDLSRGEGLERVSYVSATSACQENRWFEVVDVKMRTEEILIKSGLAYTIFRPTWAMETLNNFMRGGRAVMIIGRNPPPLHFFAAADFGRIVGASYDDDRAVSRQLYVHGPEGVTLPDALGRLYATCHPNLKIMRMKLWQAQLLATLVRHLGYVTRLIAFFDRIGELGDPSEANALFGAPSITLDEWIEAQRVSALKE